jgi:hypothetical protein
MLTSFLVAPVLLATQTDDGSATVKAALEATGLKFEMTASKRSYRLIFDHANNRKQTVFLTVTPSQIGSFTTYSLYTQVWYRKEAPTSELLQKVFSKTKKQGAFYLVTDSTGFALRFGVRFNAIAMPKNPTAKDLAVARLRDTIQFVSTVGEETDLELNGKIDKL